MSVGPNQPVDMNQIEQARQRVNKLTEELAHLSEQELAPAEYYGEFLQRILAILEAPAGAVWVRTPQGNLQRMKIAGRHRQFFCDRPFIQFQRRLGRVLHRGSGVARHRKKPCGGDRLDARQRSGSANQVAKERGFLPVRIVARRGQ